MRCLVVGVVGLAVLASCGPSAAPPAKTPARPVPITSPIVEQPKTCTDAAFGIDRAAKDLHPPEQEVVPPVRARCQGEEWSQAVIDCFAALTSESDLSGCVARLPTELRAPLLAEIRGAQSDPSAELAEVVGRLATIQVGITACDQFVAAVTRMMECTGLDAEARIQLGTETVEAWSLPMHRVSLQDKAKLAGACMQSLESLKRHATDLACTL